MTDNDQKITPRTARLVGITLTAMLALALIPSTTALAEPSFHPIGGTFTGLGLGPEKLLFGGNEVKCEHNTASGTISSATLAGGVVVRFTGCVSSSKTKSGCPVLSVGVAAGTLSTNTLHGVLGLILPKGTGSGGGLLLLPVASKTFLTLEANACTVETNIKGSVAGEANPIGKGLLSNGTLLFQEAANGMGGSIKDFDLSTGGLIQPELELFGAEGSFEGLEDLSFTPNVEVS